MTAPTPEQWDLEIDVAVVGSGGAGLAAAILAHDHGARVAVLESSAKVGGTTAVSGGGLWIPLNHHMAEIGETDSREEALTYCKRLTDGQAPDELVETFVDTGHVMVRYLEEHTPLSFSACDMPDYRPEEPGGKLRGRTLDPEMLVKAELGEWAEKLRPSPLMFVPLKIVEGLQGMAKPKDVDVGAIVDRMKRGMVGAGNALIGRLLKACIDREITFLMETRARELVTDDSGVAGLRAEREGADYHIRAGGGVVLASGGFEWSDELRGRYQPAKLTDHCSPASNEGDGLVMALDVGADVGNMNEVWSYPGATVPGEEHEGRSVSRWVIAERTLPHAILVNRGGERFTNEGENYNDMSKALLEFDPETQQPRNLPCWAIMDSQYRAKYPLLTMLPGDPDPDWLASADTLAGLAEKAGIDAKGLAATVERWNAFVQNGSDDDFHRGEGAYEHWLGDPDAPHPNLGAIETPPYYALPVAAHSSGTKGGPRTNRHGQVLNGQGEAIRGLYAAGNVMAGISGPGYYGGGGTIGLAMTWGYICGIHAANNGAANNRGS